EHVEADLPLLGLIPPSGNEFEPGIRIDEASDQPGAHHPVNVNSFARHPNASAILARRLRGVIFFRAVRIQAGLETREQAFGTLPAQGVKEIYRDDLI